MFFFFNLTLTDNTWPIAAMVLSILLVLLCLATGGLRALSVPSRQGAAIATVFLLSFLWMLKASVQGTLTVTLAGAALTVVMFGLRGALLILALACLGYLGLDHLSDFWSHHAALSTPHGIPAGSSGTGPHTTATDLRAHWNNLGLQFLLGSALPAVLARLGIAAVRHFLPRQLFVFIFGHGFFVPALATVMTLIVGALVLFQLEVEGSQRIFSDVLPGTLLLAWGEAFLSGALTVIFIMFRPHWVLSFNDETYLKKRTDP